MSPAPAPNLDTRRKAAVLVLALGPDVAARALRCMKPEAVAELARAVNELERAPIAKEVVEGVLAEFRGRLVEQSTALSPTDGALEKLLAASIGAERGAGLVKEIEREKRSENPFAAFAELEAQELSEALDGELLQVQALVLGSVPTELASKVLQSRTEEERLELLFRMAKLEEVPAEVSLEVGAALGRAAERRGTKRRAAGGAVGAKKAGNARVRAVASILNVLEGDEKSRGLGQKLREKDAALAQAIEEQTVVFEDLALLDSRALQKLLGQVDSKTLALALKGADPAVSEVLLKNLSKRAQETVLEEKELLGPQALSAVEDAQREMLAVVRALLASGEIKLSRNKEANLVQ